MNFRKLGYIVELGEYDVCVQRRAWSRSTTPTVIRVQQKAASSSTTSSTTPPTPAECSGRKTSRSICILLYLTSNKNQSLILMCHLPH